MVNADADWVDISGFMEKHTSWVYNWTFAGIVAAKGMPMIGFAHISL